ncbi:hypothetical protein LO763_25950 [Glycomyces sp. A-F 0318]|uniref:DNA sulfur modification protein DndB n=1 Tax=Glycomyces amatae TaxID=2881355 RepID=UPI001E349360|nr:DNA sulfur modification protein DndB [Glycomyces amatae]MCD0447066.1 hypothetical protein [Glycomyces amatae]
MPSTAPEGIRLTVIPNRSHAAVGVMGVTTLLQLVPSPKKEESAQALKHADVFMQRHAIIRAEVQRVLKGSKGKNVEPYARYLAEALNGEYGEAYSTPPITLWLAGDAQSVSGEIVPDTGICNVIVNPSSPVVAIDGETQVTAWHELSTNPEKYGITFEQIQSARVPFEIYFDITVDDARQIFHDRNVKGVAVSKNLSMSMDQRDLATQIARRLVDTVKVEQDGKYRPLRELVEFRERQLTRSTGAIVTLSALRDLVLSSIHGRKGIGMSATDTAGEALPGGVSSNQMKEELLPILTVLLDRLYPHLTGETVVSSPAVLAGLGVAVHRSVSWSTEGPALTRQDLIDLVDSVQWARDVRFWDGIAGNVSKTGALSFGGGTKIHGSRVADALLDPDSANGRKIRGWN